VLDAKQLVFPRGYQERRQSAGTSIVRLEREVQKALSDYPFTIMNKGVTPPSGTNTIIGQARTLARPKQAERPAHIRRDGERNPEINKITDHKSIDDLENAVETLALAYH
jgi:hypothetical protein